MMSGKIPRRKYNWRIEIGNSEVEMEEAAGIKQRLKPFKLFIDGRWQYPVSEQMIPVMNPATGEVLTTVPDAAPEDIDRAVQAARRSFETGAWRKLNVSKR